MIRRTKRMNKALSKSKVLLLRRSSAIIALAGSVIALALMLFGFISIGGRALTLTGTVNLLFYVLDFGARPFISIVLNVGFAALYYLLCFKVLILIIKSARLVRLWLNSKLDSNPTRSAAFECTRCFAFSLFALCAELIASKAAFGGTVSLGTVLILVTLAILSLVADALYFYMSNRDVFESITVNLCRLGTVVGAMLFAFLACPGDIEALWNSIGKFFSMLSILDADGAFLLDALLNTIAFPAARLIFLYATAKIAYQSFVSRYEVRDSAAKLLKWAAIFLAIEVVANGLLCESRDVEEYVELFLRGGLFATVPAYMYLITRNIYVTSKEAPYAGDESVGEDDSDAESVDAAEVS